MESTEQLMKGAPLATSTKWLRGTTDNDHLKTSVVNCRAI